MKGQHAIFTLYLFFNLFYLNAQISPERLPYNPIIYNQVTSSKLAVFLIDFTDIPPVQRAEFPTKSNWEEILFSDTSKIVKYFKNLSYGDFTLDGDVYDYTTSNVTFWNDPSAWNIASEVDVLNSIDITAPGFDINTIDHCVFIICHDAAIGQSITTNQNFTINGQAYNENCIVTYFQKGDWGRDAATFFYSDQLVSKRNYVIPVNATTLIEQPVIHDYSHFYGTFLHEVGHIMGISDHANSSTNGANYDYEPEITNNSDFMNHDYGNKYELMGKQQYGIGMNGGYRDIIGFMDTSMISTSNWYGTVTHTVHPIASTTGKRYIEILMPDQINFMGYKRTGYGLEIKTANGLDTMLTVPELSGNTDGFFVYKIDGVHNKLLDMSPSANVTDQNSGAVYADIRDVVLKPGMSYENNDILLENVVNNGDGTFSIDVTIKTDLNVTPAINFTSCERLNPQDEIKIEWSHNCVFCQPDQLFLIEYKHIDSTSWESIVDADLASGTYTTSFASGNSNIYMFRGIIYENSVNTTSLYSNTIYSDLTSEIVEITDDQFIIYPNPINSSFTIITQHQVEEITLVDAVGNGIPILKTSPNEFKLKNNNLPSGIYFVKIEVNGKSSINKIVKE